MSVRGLHYEKNEVGKHIKGSKVHHLWKIELDGKEHKIELLTSVVSGMKRVLKDGYLVLEKQMRFGNFQHSLPIDGHMISIVEQGDRYDLRIDNQPFSLLYLSEKNKSNFRQEGTSPSGGFPTTSYPGSSHLQHSVSMGQPPKKSHVEKKRDPFEFDTGFGMFEYKPTSETRPKQNTYKPPRKEYHTNFEWGNEPEPQATRYKPPTAAQQENFSWDRPSEFQFEDSSAARKPTKPGIFAQPAAPPPVKNRVSEPAPKKEEPKPIIDLLDSGPQSSLPADLFEVDESKMPPLTVKPKEEPKQETILGFTEQQNKTPVAPAPLNQAPMAAEEKKMPAKSSDMAGFLDFSPEVKPKPTQNADPFFGANGFNPAPMESKPANEQKPYFTSQPAMMGGMPPMGGMPQMPMNPGMDPFAMMYMTNMAYMNPMMMPRPYPMNSMGPMGPMGARPPAGPAQPNTHQPAANAKSSPFDF